MNRSIHLSNARTEWHGAVPMSDGQARLWFLDRLGGLGAQYNLPFAFRAVGDLDIAALDASLAGVAIRHEALRTNLCMHGTTPVQTFSDRTPALEIHDLTHVGAAEVERQAAAIVTDAAERPFDLEHDLLLRAVVIRMSERDHRLVIVLHHAIADGWSMDVLMHDLAAIYEATIAGARASLPDLPLQYADYAVWQQTWLQSDAARASLDYWRSQLAGAPGALRLPWDHARPRDRRYAGARCGFAVDAAVGDALLQLGRVARVTPFTLFLAAFAALLSRYARQTDMVVGTPGAARTRSELEGIVGFFVNMLPLRIDLSGEPPFLDVLARVHRTLRAAMSHQDYPFGAVVEALNPDRRPGWHPFFQVTFGLDAEPRPRRMGPVELVPVSLGLETTKFDLNLWMTTGARGVRGVFDYTADLFEPGTIDGLTQDFMRLLAGVASDPNRTVGDVIAPAARRRNPGALANVVQPPAVATLPLQVRHHALSAPSAVALRAGAVELSYAELSRRMHRCASRIRASDLPAGPVAVYAESSADLVVGLLAVLATERVCVPLDPRLDVEPLEQILTAAGVSAILTTGACTGRLPNTWRQLRIDDDGDSHVAGTDACDLDTPVEEPATACLLYRIDSSGRPHAVSLTPRALVAAGDRSDTAIGAADRVAVELGFGNDVDGLTLCRTLAAGACAVDLSPVARSAPLAFGRFLRQERVTVLIAGAERLERLASEFPHQLRDVRLLLANDGIREHALRFGTVPATLRNRLYVSYVVPEIGGPLALFRPADRSIGAVHPAGWTPILIDEQQRRLGPGPIGELCLPLEIVNDAGDLLGSTAHQHLCVTADGTWCYRTGDLARLRADGSLIWCGRAGVERHADSGAPASTSAADYVAPRTAFERMLADIWTTLLRSGSTAPIGIHDNFFVLGGYSLLATRMVAHVRHATGIDVPLRQIFETPTIAGLTAAMDAAPSATAPMVPLVRREQRDDCRASYAQRRLWFLDRLVPPHVYNIPLAFRVAGVLDSQALQRAVDDVVARHESLRTTFVATTGVPMQRIAATPQVVVGEVDLGHLAIDARDAEARRRVQAWAAEPFDLERGPLLRVRLARLGDEAIVLLTVHHIVMDAWSLTVMLRELGAAYRARIAGHEPELPPVPLQYGDFAEWQWHRLEDGTMDAQLAYWTRQLAGVPVLDLPVDRPRPRRLSYQGSVVRVSVPAVTAAALKTLGHEERATLFMTLLAAFQALLSRWSGQNDIAVGTPIAGRGHRDLDDVVGFFLNTVVIRTPLHGDRTFRDLVRLVRDTTLDAFAQQDLPFDRVIEALAPERTLSFQPLFQAMFVFLATPAEPLVLGDVDVRPVPVTTGTAKFDLLLGLEDRGDGFVGAIEYSTDLFDAATVERFAAHYTRLLAAVAASPDRRLHDLPLLDDDERRALIAPAGRVTRVVDGPGLLHELFERQVRVAPDLPAIVDGPHAISYRDLDARANRLARQLQREGVRPGAHVGICCPSSSSALTAILAILKAGAAYVPVDPDYPADRVRFMTADASLRLLVADDAAVALLGGIETAVVTLDDLDRRSRALDVSKPDVDIDPSSTAYVIYTSGSTGRPKGVVMPHAALANLMAWQIAESGGPLRTLQNTSLSFDVSCQEIFATWGAGGALVVVDASVKRDPVALLEVIERAGIERLFVPFVLLQRLAESARTRNETLKEIITAGEQLKSTPELARWFSTLLPNAHLINQYGPSEAHVVTSFELPGDTEGWPPLPPLGYAIANVDACVLDPWLQVVPTGIVGEIHLGGVALAHGYHQRPALTAGRFVADPISGRAGARLYRTGDLGRYRPDGTIEFLGRLDNQVKIRGYRIEPGEIEAALTGIDGITEAVVMPRSTPSGDRRLIGYVLGAEPIGLTPAAIKDRLAATLPGYMVPPEIVIVSEWPLTATGKIDRARLPHPSETPPASPAPARPLTPTERILCDIWRDLLDARAPDAAANFFDLGGHSLLVTQMLARVRDRLGVDVPVRAVFDAPTLEGLARIADDVRAMGRPLGDASSCVVTLQRGGASLPFYCIHPATGSAMGYRDLVDALGPEATVHAIEAPADAIDGPLATIEQIASRYVDDILRRSPGTHIALGGWSVGGLIAFEMARRLPARGVVATPVVLFDTFAPAPSTEQSAQADHLAELLGDASALDGIDVDEGPAHESVAPRDVRAVIRRVMTGHGVPLPYITTEQVRRLVRLCARHMWAMLRYDPPACAQAVVLFEAAASDHSRATRHGGWTRLSGHQLTRHVIAADHYTLLGQPHVDVIAGYLRDLLFAPARASASPHAAHQSCPQQ